jgi:uncharacterized protein
MDWAGIAAVGLAVGFLAGLFGKGGSAIATPLLNAIGVPAMVALAAPLPAAIPSTLAGTAAYWRGHFVDREVLRWSVLVGVPAAVVGATLTRWIPGDALIGATDLFVGAIGLRLLVRGCDLPEVVRDESRVRMVVVGSAVGLASGLLANSGGFLLVPLYLTVLHMPIKQSFATSLAVSTVLAVPGTAVHTALGHIDWRVVVVFGLASTPMSFLGAKVAQKVESGRLERMYGAALTVLGAAFLSKILQ